MDTRSINVGDLIRITKVDEPKLKKLKEELQRMIEKAPLLQRLQTEINLVQDSAGRTAIVADTLEGGQVLLFRNGKYITINIDCVKPLS